MLEVLIEKDEQAHKNIGDPSVFMNQHDIEGEVEFTGNAIASGEKAAEFERRLTPRSNSGDDLLALFMGHDLGDGGAGGNGEADPGAGGSPSGAPGTSQATARPSAPKPLFNSDFAYCEAALEHLSRDHPELRYEADPASRTLTLHAPPDLLSRFERLPPEIRPERGRLVLTSDLGAMDEAIRDSRRTDRAWPTMQYLRRLHPVVRYLDDRMLAAFGRHDAPVLAGVPGLAANEAAFVLAGR